MQAAAAAEFLQGHGGKVHRDRFSGEGPPLTVQSSLLVAALLRMVGWGMISSVAAQRLAECAVADGADKSELHDLAAIGGAGAHAGNSRRDLLRRFAHGAHLPKPLSVQVETLNKWKRRETTPQSVLSLPELLEGLWTHHRSFLPELLGPSPRSFWESVAADDPRWDIMPPGLRDVDNWRDITWPFVLHGDGGVYTRKTSGTVNVVSASSLLAKRFDSNIIPGFALPAEIDISHAEPLWRAYVHCLNSCFDGKHANVDYLGQPWPVGSLQRRLAEKGILCDGNVRIVVWTLTADLFFCATI